VRCLKCLKCLNFVHLSFKNIGFFTHEFDSKNKVCTASNVKTVKAPLQSSTMIYCSKGVMLTHAAVVVWSR
jgi:hypothetical protein